MRPNKPNTLQPVQGCQPPWKAEQCTSTPHPRRPGPRPGNQFIPSVPLPIPTKARLRTWLNVVTIQRRPPLARNRPSRSQRRHHRPEAHGLPAPQIARRNSSILCTKRAISPATRRQLSLLHRGLQRLRAPLLLPQRARCRLSRRRWFHRTLLAVAALKTTSTISSRRASPSLRAALHPSLCPNPLHSLRSVPRTRQTQPVRRGSTLRPRRRLHRSPSARSPCNPSRL